MRRNRGTGMATIPDVARQAGVSTATAARALGGYGSVSPATYQRVLDAANGLGYRPNGLARSMITGTTQTLGVVLADIENPFFYRALRGITDTARSRGYDVVLANTDEDAENEGKALSILAERRVDGLIICPANGDDRSHLTDLVASGLPVVLLDRPVPGLAADMVGLDNRKAAAEATQCLIDHGHTRIAIVTGGPPSIEPTLRRPGMRGVQNISVTTLGSRAAGYRDALVAAGIGLRPDYLSANGFHRDDATAATKAFLALPEPPTAILAFDSILSLGVLLGLRELGLRCPDDVSLIGFDDAEWAEVVTPPMTVLRQPVYEIGAKACELLLDRVAGADRRPSRHRLLGRLVERESVAAPPASRPVQGVS
jgi:LacI family transcriptional regulator